MARKNSDAKLRAVRKYNDKNYMQIGLRVPIADGEAFKAKCKEKGIATYVSSFKQEANDLYATSIDILDAGALPLINISTEAAFAKLMVAYNQKDMEPAEFMKENVYYEILPAAKL